MMTTEAAALKRAIKCLGSQVALGRALGKRQSVVSYWLHQGRVPAEQAVKIEKALRGAVKRWELRPDLFDMPSAPAAGDPRVTPGDDASEEEAA